MAEWAAVKAQIETLLDAAPSATKDKLLVGADLAARTRAHAAAEALHKTFLERLKAFRVLDPACGSGNFLNLSLTELKNIEHRTNLEAEALGLPRAFPSIGPESVLGIELNPYAAELARVSVWIGEIQWMRRNGFETARNPILRTLDTIECRDAVLGPDGGRAEWPKADVVVGNPPFLGNKKMIAELGEAYTIMLRKAWGNVPGGVDLVAYWFAKAWEQMQKGRLQRAGLVSTNSIRGGANREVLKPIVNGGQILEAWSDEDWTVEGAAVRVSLTCFHPQKGAAAKLDGKPVIEIFSDLTSNSSQTDITRAKQLIQNQRSIFQGVKFVGAFDLDALSAESMLAAPLNPNGRSNSDVVKLWTTGNDVTGRPQRRWVVDFGADRSEEDAALYERPFAHVLIFVKPTRTAVLRDTRRLNWWKHGELNRGMRAASLGMNRVISTPEVSKFRLFVWRQTSILPTGSLYSIMRDDDTTFGILHSRFHELWALRMGTSLGPTPRYTPSSTFDTFPFPEGLTPNIPAAAYATDPRAQKIAAAARLNTLRENWLNPPDLIQRVPEVVPGYPDRILPVSPEAEKTLKTRTLTNLYNQRPAWLGHAHKALDEAVAEAYGWGDDFRAGKLTEDEILARLFRLNQDRAAAQA